MNEQDTSVLEQYDLEVFRTCRGRGAILCETSRGLKLLKECRASAKRVEAEAELLDRLGGESGILADRYVRNRENGVISTEEDGTSYILKDWYEGRECSAREEEEMLQAVRSLAGLHRALRGLALEEEKLREFGQTPSLKIVLEKHNRELKRARNYIRNTVQKQEFELCVIRSFERFYSQAQKALFLLAEQAGEPARQLCHGDFTQHHVLMGRFGAAIVDFSRATMGVQVSDLYLFMRKMLEKNNWNLPLGIAMKEAYEEILPLSGPEKKYLYILFLYPEKYWKQINYYYNANKAWIPGRNIGKLTVLEAQFEAREHFLKRLEREF
ncbi:MAG: phosphotransferase [Lachnospiraceae bacterium]|nr:phosphotransferase [Lachnospiraceae bacterium]